MADRAPLVLSLVLIAAMAAISAVSWPLIPAGHIAIHFDINGRPDGFADRWFALTVMPLVASFVTAVFALAPRLGGRAGDRLLSGTKAWTAIWIGTVLVLGVAHVLIILYARHVLVDVAANAIAMTAVLLMVAGNFLGKIAPNDWAGVRTPWTRASDYAWEKTNRLGGWMLVGVGFCTLATFAFANRHAAVLVLIAGVAATLFVTFPMSRYYWKRDPDRGMR